MCKECWESELARKERERYGQRFQPLVLKECTIILLREEGTPEPVEMVCVRCASLEKVVVRPLGRTISDWVWLLVRVQDSREALYLNCGAFDRQAETAGMVRLVTQNLWLCSECYMPAVGGC